MLLLSLGDYALLPDTTFRSGKASLVLPDRGMSAAGSRCQFSLDTDTDALIAIMQKISEQRRVSTGWKAARRTMIRRWCPRGSAGKSFGNEVLAVRRRYWFWGGPKGDRDRTSRAVLDDGEQAGPAKRRASCKSDRWW
jgi:hypothetical protein